jgi:uncharacterized RDD family membrane protein YckC
VHFREAAEAWAVLSDGRVASCRGPDGDARALAVFRETLAWRARSLAERGLRLETILDALMQDGCPQPVAWAAAQAAFAEDVPDESDPAVAPAPVVLDEDVPVLAAAKAAAAAMNDADRRGALGVGRGADTAGAPRFAAGARVAPSKDEDAPVPKHAARTGAAPRRRGPSAPARAGLRGPASRGVAQADDDVEPLDATADLDARLEERAAAAIADLGMVALAGIVPAVLLGRLLELSPLAVERIAIATVLAGAAAWFVKGELAWGATPGKRLLGLSVERLDGEPLDARTAWVRHGVRTMSLLLGGLGFATAAITEHRQALHDLLTETRVRRRPRSARPAPRSAAWPVELDHRSPTWATPALCSALASADLRDHRGDALAPTRRSPASSPACVDQGAAGLDPSTLASISDLISRAASAERCASVRTSRRRPRSRGPARRRARPRPPRSAPGCSSGTRSRRSRR